MTAADRLVSDYLDRLDSELAALPQTGRREVIDGVEAHIAEGRAELSPDDEVGVRNLLERLGDPVEIAEDAQDRFGVGPKKSTTWREIAALILLPFGCSILPVLAAEGHPAFGWFFGAVLWFAGVGLLWISEAWTTRDKMIGTLVWPGGLFVPFLLLSGAAAGTSQSTSAWIVVPLVALWILIVAAPILTEGYLIWRFKKLLA